MAYVCLDQMTKPQTNGCFKSKLITFSCIIIMHMHFESRAYTHIHIIIVPHTLRTLLLAYLLLIFAFFLLRDADGHRLQIFFKRQLTVAICRL